MLASAEVPLMEIVVGCVAPVLSRTNPGGENDIDPVGGETSSRKVLLLAASWPALA
jgi:hypothetical protein